MTVAMETIRSLRAVTPQNTIIEAQHVGQRFTADNWPDWSSRPAARSSIAARP